MKRYYLKRASVWGSDVLRQCLLFLVLLVAGCAGLKTPIAPLDGFAASGRVSIRAGDESHYANFGWQAERQTDRLSFGNPLGQTLAELEIHYQQAVPTYAILRDSDGKAQTGEPESLLLKSTGMRLPVAGLRWWLQGLPAPGEANVQQTEAGRLIEQDGWRVLASDFAETSPALRGPRKIVLTRGDVTVRIVISEWQWQTSLRP